MKNKNFNIILICLIGMLAGCGSNNQNAVEEEKMQSNGIEENEVVQDKTEISMENLKNAEDTDIEQLEYTVLEGVVTITGCSDNVEILVIPDEIEGCPVVKIGKTAFRNNENLKAVRIGNNVTIIRDQAFINCVSLRYVVFGNSVETLEENCFVGCNELQEVLLNDGLITIEEMALYANISNPLVIPKSVTEIGDAGVGTYTTVHVYAGSPAEKLLEEYAKMYTGYTYEVIE